MLGEENQEHYKKNYKPYLQGNSGLYVYRIKGEELKGHPQPICELMYFLVKKLRDSYQKGATYQILEWVFHEPFTFYDDGLCLRQRKKLSAGSVQSSGDWEATYRRKNDEGDHGYIVTLTETSDPEKNFQLINKVRVKTISTEDAYMLKEALYDL